MASRETEVREFITEERVAGRRLVLVDTPGFDADSPSDADALSKIGIWLSEMSVRTHELGRSLLTFLQPSPQRVTFWGTSAPEGRLITPHWHVPEPVTSI